MTAEQGRVSPPTSGDEIGLVSESYTFGAPRYERKFLSTGVSWSALAHLVRLHPAIFSQAFPPRTVNNIYLDTPALDNFHDNVVGRRDRLKVRIRWYGAPGEVIERPILELKRKDGLVGWKAHYELAPFALQPGFGRHTLSELFTRSALPAFVAGLLKHLDPALLNRYQRRYYVSADHNFRVTIDSDLVFHRLLPRANLFCATGARSDAAILELKYAPEFDLFADTIANRFPLRVTKSSKYVSGIEAVGFG